MSWAFNQFLGKPKLRRLTLRFLLSGLVITFTLLPSILYCFAGIVCNWAMIVGSAKGFLDAYFVLIMVIERLPVSKGTLALNLNGLPSSAHLLLPSLGPALVPLKKKLFVPAQEQ